MEQKVKLPPELRRGILAKIREMDEKNPRIIKIDENETRRACGETSSDRLIGLMAVLSFLGCKNMCWRVGSRLRGFRVSFDYGPDRQVSGLVWPGPNQKLKIRLRVI